MFDSCRTWSETVKWWSMYTKSKMSNRFVVAMYDKVQTSWWWHMRLIHVELKIQPSLIRTCHILWKWYFFLVLPTYWVQNLFASNRCKMKIIGLASVDIKIGPIKLYVWMLPDVWMWSYWNMRIKSYESDELAAISVESNTCLWNIRSMVENIVNCLYVKTFFNFGERCV